MRQLPGQVEWQLLNGPSGSTLVRVRTGSDCGLGMPASSSSRAADTLPWPYEILALVDAAMSATSGIVPTARLMARLQDQALAWGADAVIGIRLSQFTLPGASHQGTRAFSSGAVWRLARGRPVGGSRVTGRVGGCPMARSLRPLSTAEPPSYS